MGAVAVQEPAAASPTVEVVGNAFVLQYYHVLHQSPEHVHRFYQEDSKIGRPAGDGAMGITSTLEAIKAKILSLDYGELRAEIKTVDAQESFGGGVLVLVTGYLTGKDEVTRNFTQAFFLAPQDNGYFVLNDAFRYVEDVKSQEGADVAVDKIDSPPTPDRNAQLQAPLLESPVSMEQEIVEKSSKSVVSTEDIDVKNEEPLGEPTVKETKEILQTSQGSISTAKDVQKKSYASIVKVPAPLPSSAPAIAKDAPKPAANQVKVAASVTVTDSPTLSKDAVQNGTLQHEEGAVGHSIYIKALPMNATPNQIEAEFKQFGPIKRGGVQVRSSKGFCFGFVEFEEASAVHKAIQSSPIIIGGHEVFAQEKKSTNSRANNKQRFPIGRENGFKNEDDRGRGSNGGTSGGYGRSGYSNSEQENASKENGFYNRGGRNGHQRSDISNDRKPSGVITNKPTLPRISVVA